MSQQNLPFDLQTIESIAVERFGKSEFYREILDALDSAPFEIPSGLLPEVLAITPEKLLNTPVILSKVEAVVRSIDTVLEDGTTKLSTVIEKISWLF